MYSGSGRSIDKRLGGGRIRRRGVEEDTKCSNRQRSRFESNWCWEKTSCASEEHELGTTEPGVACILKRKLSGGRLSYLCAHLVKVKLCVASK